MVSVKNVGGVEFLQVFDKGLIALKDVVHIDFTNSEQTTINFSNGGRQIFYTNISESLRKFFNPAT